MTAASRIGIVGAGNIGTTMAALLSRSGAEVTLAARGARGQAVRAGGVVLDDRGEVIAARPSVVDAISEPMDALFLCVKSQALAGAVAGNLAAISPKTLVVPMVNGMPFWFFADAAGMGQVPGLDPDGVLAASLSPQQVLGAVLLMTVRSDADGRAVSSNTPTLVLGPVVKEARAEPLARLAERLNSGGVRTSIAEDIRQQVLTKLLANLATNPLSALTGAVLEEIGRSPDLKAIALRLARDFRRWASGRGYALMPDDQLVDLLLDAGPFQTSMLQDACAGRPLELDAICRAPLAMAQRDGTEMPLLASLLAELESAADLPLTGGAVPQAVARLTAPHPLRTA